MIKHSIYSCLALGMLIITACSEEKFVTNEGEGRLVISTSVSALSNEVIARGVSEEETSRLLESLHVVISRSNGDAIRYWRNYQEMIDDGVAVEGGSEISVNLNTDTYRIEGWAGDSVPASFEHRFYRGETKVTLQPYIDNKAELTCKIRNVATKVEYAPEISEYLYNYKFTVNNEDGLLEFVGDDERTGYFMMSKGDNYIEWELTGTLKTGAPYVKTGRTRVSPANLYTYKFEFDPVIDERGGSIIKVLVEETPLETIEEPMVIFRTNPKVLRLENEVEIELGEQNAMASATGYVGKLDFVVKSSGEITDVVLSSRMLESSPYADMLRSGFSLLPSDEDMEGMEIVEAGEVVLDSVKETSTFSFSFMEAFTNQLEEGNYKFTITAYDKDFGLSASTVPVKTTMADFYLSVSDDGTIAVSLTSSDRSKIGPNNAVLRGRVMGDNITNAGFKIRESGSDIPWETIDFIPCPEGTDFTNGNDFTAEITDIHEGRTFEYITVFATDDNELRDGAVIRTFTTVSPQLPNSSFEYWGSGTPLFIFNDNAEEEFYPGAETVGSNREMFWDSGNQGSSTLNTNVTTKATDIKHDGLASAKLTSQFVSFLGLGKFAAGNMFIGKYLKTNGTNGGELGWGRPFTYRPKALKVWVKYNRGTVDRYNSNPYVTNGGPDQGIIYLALLTDDVTTHGITYDGVGYPIHIDTRYTNTFFDKDWDTVIASGEHIFYESTEGDGMVEITIPLEYKAGREDERPTYIMMTCSASRAGDYFCGSTSSVMWIDSMELVY